MTSVTKPHLIQVYCIAEISLTVVNEFLTQAYESSNNHYQYCLITSQEVTSIPGPSLPPGESFRSEFIGESFLSAFVGEFSPGYADKYAAANPALHNDAVIYLDDQTARDSASCLIVAKKGAMVRSTFGHSMSVISEAIEGARSEQQFLNDAALVGGILNGVTSFEERPVSEATKDMIRDLEVKEAEGWKPPKDADSDKPIPVFCTARITEDVLNDFLGRAYDEFQDDAMMAGPNPVWFRIMDSLHVQSLTEPSKPPVRLADFPFLNVNADIISKFVKQRCPGSPVENTVFVILDKYTVSNRTCIVAEHSYDEDAPLRLVRTTFKYALNMAYSLASGAGPAYAEHAYGAMCEFDGVDRLKLSDADP